MRCPSLCVAVATAGLLAGFGTAGCGSHVAAVPATEAPKGAAERPPRSADTVRLLFVGDVMLGRGVARTAAAKSGELFDGVRFEVASADLAAGNLESPLTSRAHDPAFGPNALEAPPASAQLLARAGFDAMSVANNHAGDAGVATVADTRKALSAAGVAAIGAGSSLAEALRPRFVDVRGIRVALLAVDATRQGPRPAPGKPGVAWWDRARVRAAVTRARSSADVVAVGIHGGAEYVPTTDPHLMRLGRLLASWGADVVWGHGPHVAQPVRVIDPDGDGRPTVIATSLGNFLFDQHLAGTRRGAIVEVLAGADGVRGLRIGSAEHVAGPVRFEGWRYPRKDAVALGGAWWTLARPVTPAAMTRPQRVAGFAGAVVDAAIGDPDGDGRFDLVVAFRRPFSPTSVGTLLGRRRLVDRNGRTAHVGLYRPRDLRARWVAGTLLRPVAAIAPCEGALAVAYSALDDPAITAAGAWRWGGFGFVPMPDLPGPGVPACADIDSEGTLDPVVLERSPR